MWQVFLRFVAISKKHLQTYIWMVLSLFQDATYSDLGYCVPLKQALAVIPFSKANSQFHCSHPYGDRLLFIIKESLQPQILSNLLCFCRAGNVAEDIIMILIHPWFQACIYWKKSVIWWHHFLPCIFSIKESLFQGSTWVDPYVKDTVFISQLLLQPFIITSCVWLTWENLKILFIRGKPL